MTQENINAVLPVLNIDSEVKDEIRDSVTVGKVATVSQNTITVGSWTGVGYIIADPETGAGAYRISGGSDGGNMPEPGTPVSLLLLSGLVFLAMLSGYSSAMADEVNQVTSNKQKFLDCMLKTVPQAAGFAMLFAAMGVVGIMIKGVAGFTVAIISFILMIYFIYSVYLSYVNCQVAPNQVRRRR